MDKNHNLIPIFPLPTTIFFPSTNLPLHIFEPRYKQMISDTLKGNGLLGMIIFEPGWEEHYFSRPKIVSVGCVGKIKDAVLLDEGKYNISLFGLNRFRIIQEISGKPYRQAEVEFLEEKNDLVLDIEKKHPLITQYENYLKLLPENTGEKQKPLELDRCETLANLVDQIAYSLGISTGQKQAFLEEQDTLKRMQTVQSMLTLNINIIHHSKILTRGGFDTRLN